MDEQSQNGESFRGNFKAHFNMPVGKNQLKKMGLLCTQLLGNCVWSILKICSFGIYKARKSFKLSVVIARAKVILKLRIF